MTKEELQKGSDSLKSFVDWFYKNEKDTELPLLFSILARDKKGDLHTVMIPIMDEELVERRQDVALQLGVAFQLALDIKKDPKKYEGLSEHPMAGNINKLLDEIKDLDKAEAIFMTSEVWVGKYDKDKDKIDDEGIPEVMPRNKPDKEEAVVISGLTDNQDSVLNLYRIKAKDGVKMVELDKEMSSGGNQKMTSSSPLLEKFWQGIKLIRDGKLPPLSDKKYYA